MTSIQSAPVREATSQTLSDVMPPATISGLDDFALMRLNSPVSIAVPLFAASAAETAVTVKALAFSSAATVSRPF